MASSVTRRHSLGIFFLLSFVLTWIFTPLISISPVLSVPGLMMPAVSAWIVLALAEGKLGVIKLGKRLQAWRAEPFWYLMALGLPLLLSLAVAYGGRLVGALEPIYLAPITPLAIIIFVMVAGEEIGWRGYALPKLLEIYPPLAASIILGLLWGLWHLPTFSLPGTPQFGVPLAAFLVYTTALSVIFTWLFNHTRGSILLATLLHGATNTFGFVNPTLQLEQRWWLIAAVYLIAAMVVVAVAGPDLKFDRTKRLRPVAESTDAITENKPADGGTR